MDHYKMNLIEYQRYAVTYEERQIGEIRMDGELGEPMFHYISADGTVKGSVPEIKDAVRALKAWHTLKGV